MASFNTYKVGGKEYGRIVESFRDDFGAPSIKTLLSIGCISNIDFTKDEIKSHLKGDNYNFHISELFKNELKKKDYDVLYKNAGYLVYKKIWDGLSLDKVFDNFKVDTDYDLVYVIKSLVFFRLIHPTSKLYVYENQNDLLGFEGIKLQYIYRSLHHLSDMGIDVVHTIDKRLNGVYGGDESVFKRLYEAYLYKKVGKFKDFYSPMMGVKFSIHNRYIEPIYVRSDESMKGHIMVCMLAYLIDRIFFKGLKKGRYDRFKHIIENGFIDAVEIDEKLYLIRRYDTRDLDKIFKIFDMKLLRDFENVERRCDL